MNSTFDFIKASEVQFTEKYDAKDILENFFLTNIIFLHVYFGHPHNISRRLFLFYFAFLFFSFHCEE